MSAHRRGLCPTLMDPLPTGDGLLVRWLPLGPLPTASFVALCEASENQGNGIIEVTARGSLQFRGFTASTAALFARRVDSLGLAGNSAPPICASPLLGLDPGGGLDLREWLIELRAALSERLDAAAINPKVSVLLDDAGALHLDDVSADVRLRVGSSSALHVSLGGNADTARALGWVALERAPEVVCEVLNQLSADGREARARDLAPLIGPLRRRLPIDQADVSRPTSRRSADPLAVYPLKNATVARGVGLAFGYSDATQLKRLAGIAQVHGADALRPAPNRALLVIGIRPDRAVEFAKEAEAAGFVMSSKDARRHVIACAGAPACPAALIATREIAPLVANAMGTDIVGADIGADALVHLSGCSKGCAHPKRATLAFVGPDRLIVDGCAGEPAVDHMTAAQFIRRVPELLRGAPHR